MSWQLRPLGVASTRSPSGRAGFTVQPFTANGMPPWLMIAMGPTFSLVETSNGAMVSG